MNEIKLCSMSLQKLHVEHTNYLFLTNFRNLDSRSLTDFLVVHTIALHQLNLKEIFEKIATQKLLHKRV